MTIKENMLSILKLIVAEGAIHLIFVAIFTEIFPEVAMPCQKLCDVKINMPVSPFNSTLYILDKSMGPSPFRRSIPSNLPFVKTLSSLWGAVKNKCYADKPEPIDALKDTICEAAHNR